MPYDRLAGGLGNRSKAKFGHVQSVLCARCDGGVGFYGLVSQRTDFFVFCAKNDISRKKKPIASASANRAVHQRTECEKKHNRAPNRVPIREILAARRGVAYSCEGGGCGGTKGDAVLDSGCAGWCPGFFSGPLAVTVFFYSHFCILYMACLCEDPSLSGQV